MRQKTFTITLLLLFCSLAGYSQVTIGIDETPAEGALLQLKTESVADGSANSQKGLLLPRVSFDLVGSATGTVEERLRTSLGLPSSVTLVSGDAERHTGLVVYNTNPATGSVSTTNSLFAETKICPGVYIWDGEKWKRSMLKECE